MNHAGLPSPPGMLLVLILPKCGHETMNMVKLAIHSLKQLISGVCCSSLSVFKAASVTTDDHT